MNIIDDDKSFGIDVGTRDVAYSGEGKTRLIQGDHNSERITFSMNRYVEQYDMSQCDKVEIHYINISSSGKERSEGVYTVADVEINPTSENEIVFSWLVSVNATRYAGSVNFLILFRNVDAEGNVTYSWSTALNKEIIIGEGMNCGDDFEEAYSDILSLWEAKVTADIKEDVLADEIKQNKTDDALITEDKTIVGAINEINNNKQAKDFVITGTVTGNLGTGDIDVSDVSCTYEEARAAFDGGRNVKCLFYVPEMGSYVEFRYKAHNEYMIMFECLWDDFHFVPVFSPNGWNWDNTFEHPDGTMFSDLTDFIGWGLEPYHREFADETENQRVIQAVTENRQRIKELESDSIKTLILTNKSGTYVSGACVLDQTYDEVYEAVTNNYRIFLVHGNSYFSATKCYVHGDDEGAVVLIDFQADEVYYTARFSTADDYKLPSTSPVLVERSVVVDALDNKKTNLALSANQGRVLNERIMALENRDYTINCDATIDNNNNITILNVSATSTDITNALDENKNVVLNVATEFGAFVTNLIITNNYEFVFLYNDAQYTIVCGSNEGWYGYVTPLATDSKLYVELAPKQNQVDTSLTTTDKTIVGAINELDAEIGDINTALETALNGGAS